MTQQDSLQNQNRKNGRYRVDWKLDFHSAFRNKKMTSQQLQDLRSRNGRFLNSSTKKQLERFYKRQNVIVDYFEEVDNLKDKILVSAEFDRGNGLHDVWAIRLSFWANIVLVILKIVLSVMSGSLSIMVSALDSVLDIVSGLILYSTARAMRKRNKYKFPVGKQRMEPLGIIIFSSIMGTVGFSVIIEGIRQLVGKPHVHHLENLALPIAGMASVVLVKLGLYLVCRKAKSDTAQAYAQDHFNDVCTNVLGLGFALLGDRVAFWLDPVGAIILATFVSYNWGRTAHEHAMNLVGMSASPEFLSKLTYLCWNHHPEIQQIDTVRGYSFGKNIVAEVDIVLHAEMPLKQAHDIGESLQIKLESLPDIERAFVHLDYEASHQPESEHPATGHVESAQLLSNYSWAYEQGSGDIEVAYGGGNFSSRWFSLSQCQSVQGAFGGDNGGEVVLEGQEIQIVKENEK